MWFAFFVPCCSYIVVGLVVGLRRSPGGRSHCARARRVVPDKLNRVVFVQNLSLMSAVVGRLDGMTALGGVAVVVGVVALGVAGYHVSRVGVAFV